MLRKFVRIIALIAAFQMLASQSPAAELVEVREPVPDSYIVVLKQDVSADLDLPLVGGVVDGVVGGVVEQLVGSVGGTLLASFDTVLAGFSLRVDAAGLGELLNDPRVAYVEQNAEVELFQTGQSTQTGASWGLDRIDQRELPLDDRYSYRNAGAGAHIYIIDSGLRVDHREFTGRVGNGVSTVRDNRGVDDCGGHGTSVAGAAAGSTYGVAKQATVHPVRVVDCNGFSTSADVIAGIDWVVRNQQRPAVVNISLGSVSSRAMRQTLANATGQGLFFVVAAGNQARDACAYSPADSDVALTVGASTRNDARADFSNTGRCVDLFAPGENILSAWDSGNQANRRLSGTSLAAPFAAGVAAVYRGQNATASPAQLLDVLRGNATSGNLRGIGRGSPNRLLYAMSGKPAGARAPEPEPVPVPPSKGPDNTAPPAAAELKASFRFRCEALVCSFDAGQSSGEISRFSWDFGDGNNGAGQTVQHSYAQPGEYRVLLETRNAAGENSLAAAEISVQAPASESTPRSGQNLCDVPLLGGLCR